MRGPTKVRRFGPAVPKVVNQAFLSWLARPPPPVAPTAVGGDLDAPPTAVGERLSDHLSRTTAAVARARAYRFARFTVKLRALLVPPAVVTATCTAPYLAFAGTLHLICVALHET